MTTAFGFRTGVLKRFSIDLHGRGEVVVRVPFALPFCMDWLPSGRLLIVSGRDYSCAESEMDPW
jgi:hypothetical protein